MVTPLPAKLICLHCGSDEDVIMRDGFPECRDRTKCWARWDKANLGEKNAKHSIKP